MDEIFDLCRRVASRLAAVKGIAAVAVGGSWARGTARADSDIDLGLYYLPERPPDIDSLRQLAREIDDRHPDDAVTGLGAWGPWVNGGAWLLIDGRRVDWLFRDLSLVRRVIDDCKAGRASCDYQVGHPHGFHNHMYMAEVHHNRPLCDPDGLVQHLQQQSAEYPPALRATLLQRFSFEARFSLEIAAKAAARGDAFYVAGCLFRSLACIVQVVFALNRRYFLNEKGAVELAQSFPVCPDGLAAAASTLWRASENDAAALQRSIETLTHMVDALDRLCADDDGVPA
jgi:predicted nucleotidyltransferase